MNGFASRAAVVWLVALATGWSEPPVPGRQWTIRSETAEPVLRPSDKDQEPWLGVSVHKPAEALYGQLVDVPKAVGFVVHKVTPDGPAALAGLRQYDFLWKLDDQLLVNEAQLLVLLHGRGAGTEVTLTYQRNGENHEATAVLGVRPSTERGREQIAVMRDPPVPGLSNQMIDILRQVAEIQDRDGMIVRLERRGDGFQWQHVGADGTVVAQGELAGGEEGSRPDVRDRGLAKKVQVLMGALEDAERRAKDRVRSPRVRRVPVQERP